MSNIFTSIVDFLETEGILPISNNWNSFNIEHKKPIDEQTRKEQYSYIKNQTGKSAGIYIYKKDEKVLYVGKAKLLFDRLKSHYIESFSPVPGDTKDMRWHRFFSLYNGKLDVYWKEIESEEERQLLELILTKLLKPVFLSFK